MGSETRVKERRLSTYNPNRFSAFDSAVIYILFLALYFAAGYGVTGLLNALYNNKMKDVFFLMNVSALVSQLLIFALVISYSKLTRTSLISGGGYKPNFKALPILYGVLIIAGMLWIFAPATNVFVDSIYALGGKIAPSINAEEADALFLLIFILFTSTVLPAVFEELLFRSVILRGLEVYGKTFAVILSALMFAMAHGSFSQFYYQFLVGLAIGTAYVLTRNIVIAMIMHFANNLLASLFALLTAGGNISFASVSQNVLASSDKLASVNSAAGIVIGTICFIAGAVYFLNVALNKNNQNRIPEDISALRTCISHSPSGEDYYFCNYDSVVPFFTNEKPVYFSWRKGFVAVRKDRRKGAALLLVSGLVLAAFLMLNDYFIFF